MKRTLPLNDADCVNTAPKRKRRRRNRSTVTSFSEENTVPPITNNNTNISSNNLQNKKKQSKLSSFFNVPVSSNSNSQSIQSDQSESDDDDDNPPKWNCNSIRGKIRKLLTTPGFKITHWLKELDINSNSYQRFMKLKGKWNNTSNQTYYAAHRYFIKQEKLKKKQKQKDKTKSAAQRKRENAKKKKQKINKEKQLEDILHKIESVQDQYDDDGAIYDDCNDVRKNIIAFLKRGIMTKSRFLKEIGNVAHNSYSSFASMGPLKLSGASNRTYPKAYHWLEKLRIAEGTKKSKKRLKNEKEYANGFPLRHDNGARWCLSNMVPVRRRDEIVMVPR